MDRFSHVDIVDVIVSEVRSFGVSIEEITRFNYISDIYSIYIGQRIRIK